MNESVPQFHVTSNIIAASAGTGKTYQLASRYIALLVLGAKPEEIIALTFTRKAAGEFRNRILHALAEGACWKPDGTKKGNRNPLTIRVWDVLSGLTIDAEGRAVPSNNKVALLPPTAALLKLAEEKGCYPEELYHEDKTLRDYYQFPEPNAETFARLLKEMVMVLSRLKLTTIDSFFASLVTTNSLELGMNSAEPLDPADEDKAQASAVRDYLDTQGTDEQTRREFLRMFCLLTGGVGNRTQSKITEELNSFLSLYRSLPSHIQWGNATVFGDGNLLNVASDDELAEYRDCGEQLLRLLNVHGDAIFSAQESKQIKDLVNGGLVLGKKAESLLNSVRSEYPFLRELEAVFAVVDNQENMTPLLVQMADSARGAASFYDWPKGAAEVLEKLGAGKKCNDKKKLSAFKSAVQRVQQMAKYHDVLYQMKRLVDRLLALSVSCRLRQFSDKTAALKTLLVGYADIYEKRMLAEGKLSFADVARMAHELMQMDMGDARLLRHHVAYRMGADLHHWMLDEFQDTSEDQFATLAPLLSPIAEDAGAHEEDFADEEWQSQAPTALQGRLEHQAHHVAADSIFVVGDAKQSIYGFRTGKTKVFDRLKTDEEWSQALQSSELTQSFRSSPVIMGQHGFVNTLFKALHRVECSGDNEGCIEKNPVTELLGFTDHLAAKDLPGYVEISVVAPPNKDDEDDDSTMKTRIFDAIVEVLSKLTGADSRPINNMSIAILVRSNTEADEIMAHLATKMPDLPRLLVKDTFAAADSPLGEMLLSFFRWLLHPSDASSLGVVRASFMGCLFGGSVAQQHAEWLQKLQSGGYAALLETLLVPLAECDRIANAHTIALWKNYALAADTSGFSLAEWVNRMQHLSVQGVSHSGSVQIMTMHKSKGLEFDAVILPYCSYQAVDSTLKLKYFVAEDGSSMLLTPGKSDELPLLDSNFTELASCWQKEQRQEAYNLLYVAITRAKHANYIICHGKTLYDPTKKTPKECWKSAARSTGGLIRQAVAILSQNSQFIEKIEENQVIYTQPQGDRKWFEKMKSAKDIAQEEIQEALPLGAAVPRRKRNTPSSLAKAEDKPFREAQDNTPTRSLETAAADFGTAVHACWEQVTWLQDAPPVWLQMPQTPAQQLVVAAIQQPDIQKLFTRQPGQEVYNEQGIEAIQHNNEWVSGTIDRLVLTTDAAGHPIAAHIIDYKTNRPVAKEGYASFYDWLRDHYEGQMKAYQELIHKALGIPQKNIKLSLVSCPADASACVVEY